jgi:hypothetical protein
MRRTAVVLLGLGLAGAAVAAEEGSLPIGDLMTRDGSVRRATRAVASSPLGVEFSARRIAGEQRLIDSGLDDNCPPWFDGQSVCTALDAALGPDVNPTGIDEKARAVTFGAENRDAVAKALADLRERAPQPIALKVSIERWPDNPGIAGPETLLSAQAHADPARTLVIADAVERQVVADFDVEIAQASCIGDPILAILRTGASAEICVTPMPDGRTAVLETVTRVARPLEEAQIDLGHEGFGRADRCAVAFDEVAACVRIGNGRASETTWTGRDGARMVLRVEAAWTLPRAPGDPAIVVSPLFRSAFMGFVHMRGTDLPNEAEVEAWGALPERTTGADEIVATAFRDPLYLLSVKSHEFVLTLPSAPPQSAAQQFERMCDAAESRMRAARVECLAVNAPAGAAVSFDTPLPQGAFTVAAFSGTATLGLPLCSTGGTERRFLADWDVEVAQSSRIPDPRLASMVTGHFLNLTPRERSVDVDLDLRRLDRMDRQLVQLAVGRVSLGIQAEKDQAAMTDPALPPERIAVEKPVVAQLRVAETVPLGADGAGSLRRGGGSFVGAGRELVVIVRVR